MLSFIHNAFLKIYVTFEIEKSISVSLTSAKHLIRRYIFYSINTYILMFIVSMHF